MRHYNTLTWSQDVTNPIPWTSILKIVWKRMHADPVLGTQNAEEP